jgi:hypothetical protein
MQTASVLPDVDAVQDATLRTYPNLSMSAEPVSVPAATFDPDVFNIANVENGLVLKTTIMLKNIPRTWNFCDVIERLKGLVNTDSFNYGEMPVDSLGESTQA